MPKLVITDGGETREASLTQEIQAGRLADNQIQLKVPEASRHHCRFFQEKGSWFVEDLGSSNGTLVNGRKVSKFELADGDVITVGAASMKFLDVEVAAAPAVEAGWGDDDEISLESETFLLLGAPRLGETVKIADRITVGRGKKHGLQIAEASVSGDHAEIVKRGAQWFVRDLGSSNGTFVDGERVKEAELASGQVVRFGVVEARFCVGRPKDFSPPVPTETAKTEAFPVDASPDFGDAAFSLHEGAPARRGGAGSLVATLLLLALGGGGVFLYMQQRRADDGDGRGAARQPARAGLIPARWSSFERPRDGEVAAESGWRKEDPTDRASVDDAASGAYSGAGCLAISRSNDADPPTYVVLDAGAETAFSVTPGGAYRLGAYVNRVDAGAHGGACVTWMTTALDAEGGYRTLGRDVVPARAGTDWTETSGVVVAPEGATTARVGAAAAGRGEILFDDVTFASADSAGPLALETRSFRASLGPSGSLRLARFGRAVADGAGVWRLPAEGDAQEPWTAFAPTGAGGDGAVVGLLRQAPAADLSIRMNATEAGFATTWTFVGATPEHALCIPLAGTAQDLNVTVFEGDRARRLRAAFENVAASSVIVGERGDRARITLKDGAGAPLAATLSVVARGGRPLLKIDRGAANTVTLDVQLGFEAEQKEGQALLQRAAEAARQGRDGEALGLYEEILTRFPFEESLEREAAQRRERLVSDAQKRFRDLSARVDDALFFRTVRIDDQLAKDLEAEAARMGGVEAASGIAAVLERFKSERAKVAAERAEAEARVAFQRAADYESQTAGGRPSRSQSAVVFYEAVARRWPDTEWGKQARAKVEQLNGRPR
ncbi:MAG TPA: FHA domain-containing protein [Planctomycetota bacterium]|nr:FHA domain-containing protein [Planctomycetota bacterium]